MKNQLALQFPTAAGNTLALLVVFFQQFYLLQTVS